MSKLLSKSLEPQEDPQTAQEYTNSDVSTPPAHNEAPDPPEEEIQQSNVDEAPISANHVQDTVQSPPQSFRATVEDVDENEDEDRRQNIDPRHTVAQEAVATAEEAAKSLDILEEQAHHAYETYQKAFYLAKTADERSLAALHLAKSTKDMYERNPYSIYHDAMQQAEDKAVSAVQYALSRSRVLNVTIENLNSLLLAREQASVHARQLAEKAVQELHKTTVVNINIGAPADVWDDEYLPELDHWDGDVLEEEEDNMDVEEDSPNPIKETRETANPPTKTVKASTTDTTVIDKKDAAAALSDITRLLKPKREVKGNRYIDPGFDSFTRSRLEAMKTLLWCYIDPISNKSWVEASLHVAQITQRGPYFARRLREYTRVYIKDREDIPQNLYGSWTESIIEQHEGLAQELNMHLQSVGKYVTASHLVRYMAREDVKLRWKLKRDISLATAKRWMKILGYRWTVQPSGQYVDGHERPDIVEYRQRVFLPAMAEYEGKIREWDRDGLTECMHPWPHDVDDGPRPFENRTVIWFHDESTFYANDRRKVGWVHKDATAVPRPKGEGASLMIADFISADYGWLRSQDNPTDSARVLFKAGAARQGYFESSDILKQTHTAMDILSKEYGHEQHVFVFDNATTHTKRASDALSARKMPKNVPKEGTNFLVERPMRGTDGKIIYGPDRKPVMESIKMANGRFHDGTEQEFYFPEGHPRAGIFKGMANILEERGYIGCTGTKGRRAECENFKCLPDATDCCCRRTLYNEPDFINVPSLLETECLARGFRVIFLPKFHCELNFIEQCWGYAKGVYRKYPPSSKEADLEINLVSAIESVPLALIRKFATRSRRFMDGYRRGLNGKQAAWANRRYRSHRVLPADIFDELKEAGLVTVNKEGN